MISLSSRIIHIFLSSITALRLLPALPVLMDLPNETGQKKAPPVLLKCPSPNCSGVLGRRQELLRHIVGHLPNYLCCRQPGCDWTGRRLDMLHNHFKNRHPGTPLPKKEVFMIYDAPGLARQVLGKKITMERAEFLGDSLFNAWALQPTLMISVG